MFFLYFSILLTPLVRLINGDCLEEMDKLIDEGVKVDLILTDPPYNVSAKNKSTKVRELKGRKPMNYYYGDWDNMERQEFLDFTKQWFSLCVNLLREGGAIISFFSKEDVNYLGWIGEGMGMKTKTIFTWHKTNPVPSLRKVNYLSSCEYAYIGAKTGENWTFNFKQQKEMHNFYETPNKTIYGQTEHPTEKPVNMFEHLVEIHSNPNDTILDCFMGSGTTGVACLQTNRNFIGIELDEKYFNIAKERCKDYQSKLI